MRDGRHGQWRRGLRGPRTSWTCAASLIVAVLMTFAAGSARASVAAPSSTDRAIFEAGVIVASDVSPAWLQTRQPTSTNDSVLRKIGACKQIVAEHTRVRTSVPTARSAEFSDPSSRNGETAVAGLVYAFKNVHEAGQYVAAFQGSAALQCIGTVSRLEAGAQAQATTSRVRDLIPVGDGSVAYESTLKGPSQQGATVALTTDTAAVRVGRAVVAVSFINAAAQRLPQGPAIIDAVVRRVEALHT